jgi:hypothetical protein
MTSMGDKRRRKPPRDDGNSLGIGITLAQPRAGQSMLLGFRAVALLCRAQHCAGI